jgi:biopolymer transport protein ExbD
MKLYPRDDSDAPSFASDGLLSEINTTPLVDVMLVLLIIFLITIPAVSSSVQVSLPKERSQLQQATPETIVITVERTGLVYWNREGPVEPAALTVGLEAVAAMSPQPEVHVRGDAGLAYAAVGQVMAAAQAVGILRVGLLTEPDAAP